MPAGPPQIAPCDLGPACIWQGKWPLCIDGDWLLAPAWQARPPGLAEPAAGTRRPGATTVTGAGRAGPDQGNGANGRLNGRVGEADVKWRPINMVPRAGHRGPAADRQVAGDERDV